MHLRDGKTHDITSGEWLDVSPVWSPDGRSLWFVSDRQGGRDVYRIAVTPAGTPAGEPERITSGAHAHTIDLSRDGRTLAYAALTAYSHIRSLPMPSGRIASVREATQITFGNEVVEGLALSPDGRWLAFDSDRGGDADIWKISVDGGEAEQLTTTPGGDFVQGWSADGRFLAIHSLHGGSRDVFVLSVDGGRAEQVVATPAQVANPDLSPDGTAIVFESDASGKDELYVAHRTGPTTHGARGGAEFAQWSRDGHTIYFKTRAAAQPAGIWAVPAEGGEPRLLVTFDDPALPSLRREFATDGKRIYFTVAQHQSDIWAVEVLQGAR